MIRIMSSKRELAERAYLAGRSRLPGAALALDQFLSFSARDDVTESALIEYGPDLFLTCACGLGDPHAIESLDREYLARAGDFLGRFRLSIDQQREHRQQLRISLLLGDRPGILSYRGAGPLGAWLRITSIRLALRLFGRPGEPHEAADSDVWNRLTSDAPNPELRVLRAEHREVFSAVLEQSLRALQPGERTLLRLHIIDGLNIDALSAIYRIHRSTAARRLIAVRDKVHAAIREALGVQLASSSSELRSLVRLVRGDVHLSLERILDAAEDGKSLSARSC